MLNTLVFFQQDKQDFCYSHVDEWVVLTGYKHFLPHLIHHELSHYTCTWGEGGTHWSFIKGGSTQVPTPYLFISHFWQKNYPTRILSNDKYSQLLPCGHSTITDSSKIACQIKLQTFDWNELPLLQTLWIYFHTKSKGKAKRLVIYKKVDFLPLGKYHWHWCDRLQVSWSSEPQQHHPLVFSSSSLFTHKKNTLKFRK